MQFEQMTLNLNSTQDCLGGCFHGYSPRLDDSKDLRYLVRIEMEKGLTGCFRRIDN